MQQTRQRRLGTLAWRAMLVRFSGSGLTIKAFCRREAVSTASFYRWRTLLGAQATAVQTRPARSVTDTFVDLGPLDERVVLDPALQPMPVDSAASA